jgi:hypothetical protein
VKPADFDPGQRARLEQWAASGCDLSRYMLKHNVGFAEAVVALHRQRCREPVPVPDDDDLFPGKKGLT